MSLQKEVAEKILESISKTIGDDYQVGNDRAEVIRTLAHAYQTIVTTAIVSQRTH